MFSIFQQSLEHFPQHLFLYHRTLKLKTYFMGVIFVKMGRLPNFEADYGQIHNYGKITVISPVFHLNMTNKSWTIVLNRFPLDIGSITVQPHLVILSRCSLVTGWFHMAVFIAGATTWVIKYNCISMQLKCTFTVYNITKPIMGF